MTRHVIQRDVTRLRVVHRQRVGRYGESEPAPAFDAAELAPEVRSSALAGWQRLVETEHESVVIAGWMIAALARLGAPLDVLGAFGRVVEDELRHVDLCAQMVEQLGGQPTVPRALAPPFPISLEGKAGEEAEFELLAGLVGFFCVFEQLSAHVFRSALDAAEVPLAHWAIGEIHRDEAFHGAFGYETAKEFVPKWSAPLRARLGERVLADVQRFEAKLRSSDAPALPQLGLLGTPELLAIFHAAVEQELRPRLGELGIALR